MSILSYMSLFLGYATINNYLNKFIVIIINLLPNATLFSTINCFCQLQNFPSLSFNNIRLEKYGMSYLTATILNIIQVIFFIFTTFFIKKYQISGLNFIDFLKSLFSKKISRNLNYNIDNNIDPKPETNFTCFHEKLSDINIELKNSFSLLYINNVSRIYGELKAVNNFTCELFKNEIFCLLGHNGAGKTTLIKMISGLEDPDQGDIFLNGTSLVTNKNFLYHNIGLCQQEDIFFDYLTVNDHLNYRLPLEMLDYKNID